MSNKRNKKGIKAEELHLIKHTTFSFIIHDNAVATAMALAQAGYFINIMKNCGLFVVDIYKRK